MADRTIMKECFRLPDDFTCNDCEYEDADTCNQQNCWYSCTVCRYNGMSTCDDE